jgi:hypothetical protein
VTVGGRFAPSPAELIQERRSDSPCGLCGSTDLKVLLRQRDVPVLCNVVWATEEDAREAPTGDVELTFCRSCGAMHNEAFDPDLTRYSPAYENSLHSSPRFQGFAEELARRLIRTYGLDGATVVEIGSGRGEFLSLLCSLGVGRGIGYDPSYAGPPTDGSGRITFVSGHYPDASRDLPHADLVCGRHVLEHVSHPPSFLQTLRAAVESESRTAVYVEVPDGGYMLREAALWDVIYEHPWYFTAPSLQRLFQDSGFSVLDVGTSFGGQYLFVEARPDSLASSVRDAYDAEVQTLAADADRFDGRCRRLIQTWGRWLQAERVAGHKVAVWGIGSKGTTFLNVVPGGEQVSSVVDLNERKHGRYVPGTGQRIVGPDGLRAAGADVVLVMNPLYVEEVRQTTISLGLHARVLSLGDCGEG